MPLPPLTGLLAFYRLLAGAQGAALNRIVTIAICAFLWSQNGEDGKRFGALDQKLAKIEESLATIPTLEAQRDGQVAEIRASMDSIREAARIAAAKADKAAELNAQHTGQLLALTERLRELSAKLDEVMRRSDRNVGATHAENGGPEGLRKGIESR
jgi:hypothetical protein